MDESLCAEGLCVDGLVCSNLCVGEGTIGQLKSKKGECIKPMTHFKGTAFDAGSFQDAAGHRHFTESWMQQSGYGAKTATNYPCCQSKSNAQARNQLEKSMSNLTLAPLKRGLRPSQVQLERTTSGDGVGAVPCVAARHKALGSAKSGKARKSRKGKGDAKNNARCRNTSKVLPFSSTANKSKVSVSVGKDQGWARQEAATPDRLNRDKHDGKETAALSDPISETLSQPQVLPESQTLGT